ncbi:MAG TPA: hypothetical protein VFX76_16370 [Roseiflexaceae bacterium]|nr:hypothetical protein [Roseiflexaceae bacterium]
MTQSIRPDMTPTLPNTVVPGSQPNAASRLVAGEQGATQRILVVEAIGLAAANGAVLRAVLEGVVASAEARCLVKIAPGVYDLGDTPLQMRDYVDVEGAGERATVLTSRVSVSMGGTVVGADNTELRHLTVANEGGQKFAVAIYNDGVAPRLVHLTALAAGAQANYGVYNCNGAAPAMVDMTATATGGSCNAGVHNDGAAPVMTRVAASGSSGHMSYGVYNTNGAAPIMTDVVATASRGSRSVGLYNDEDAWPTLTDVIAYASGGVQNINVYNGN